LHDFSRYTCIRHKYIPIQQIREITMAYTTLYRCIIHLGSVIDDALFCGHLQNVLFMYRCRGRAAIYTYFEQGGIFIISHLLRHGTCFCPQRTAVFNRLLHVRSIQKALIIQPGFHGPKMLYRQGSLVCKLNTFYFHF
jgi:hypothetical protein